LLHIEWSNLNLCRRFKSFSFFFSNNKPSLAHLFSITITVINCFSLELWCHCNVAKM
jgi:hypothetical protein